MNFMVVNFLVSEGFGDRCVARNYPTAGMDVVRLGGQVARCNLIVSV
jgi:hypothetical protein